RVFLTGTVMIAAGSLVVASAQSYPQVLIGRGISGLGGALVLPTSLALITTTFFVDLPRMLRYIAVWVSVSGVGLAVGPLLGGTHAGRRHDGQRPLHGGVVRRGGRPVRVRRRGLPGGALPATGPRLRPLGHRHTAAARDARVRRGDGHGAAAGGTGPPGAAAG